MKKIITFDHSLSLFVTALTEILEISSIAEGWVIRDASGKLTFVLPDSLAMEDIADKSARIAVLLDGYCSNNCLLSFDYPGIRTIVQTSQKFMVPVPLDKGKGNCNVILIDRRIIGGDWLCNPAPSWKSPAPARLVFASQKGGVGRSTSLAVVAVELSSIGKKVLAVDLDLEAPGIGTMLLRPSEHPKFGALDWYVESGIENSSVRKKNVLEGMVGISSFGSSNGYIHVVPAIGTIADNHPYNVLAKISRAYLESRTDDGKPVGFLAKTQEMIRELTLLNSYDVILIDARAGLNESTAAAILGLGADILLFGIDTPQTFASYRYLLSHLAQFDRDEDDDWLYRIKMVHAKASRELAEQEAFRDRAFDIFKELIYRRLPLKDAGGNLIVDREGNLLTMEEEFGLTDPNAPHFAWPVLSDLNYAEFNPCSKESQLKPEFYSETYAGLVSGVKMLLETQEVA